MEVVLALLLAQALLGAFDTWVIHEWHEGLNRRGTARREVGLHALREYLYAVIFLGLALLEWRGLWVLVMVTIMLVEVIITALDFVEEDRTRRLAALERVTHLLLAVLYGALLGLLAPIFVDGFRHATELKPAWHGGLSLIIAVFGIVVLLQAVRTTRAWLALAPSHQAQCPAPH